MIFYLYMKILLFACFAAHTMLSVALRIWIRCFHINTLSICSICGHDAYPCFELSAINADKPPLTVSQIKERVKQFEKVGEADQSFSFQA